MRCPDCNKFTAKNTEVDPEVTTDPEVEDDTVKVSVKITNQCEDCSTDLEEAEFDMELDLDSEPDKKSGNSIEWKGTTLKEHQGEGHKLVVNGDPDVERTDSGGGRYAKRMLGVDVTVSIACECDDAQIATVVLHDEIASSQMDSLV